MSRVKAFNTALVFDQVFQKISVERFLKNNAGGELPFYIQSYPIELENDVVEQTALLKKRLEDIGRAILEVNLYDLCLSVLSERNLLNAVFLNETRLPKNRILRDLVSVLNTKVLIAKIEQQIAAYQPQIVFITGISAIYPLIRSHTILNNLQNISTGIPILMFYPGTYDNEHLILFDRLTDDNYYRAHNLDNFIL